MRSTRRVIGVVGVVAALAIGACGGSDKPDSGGQGAGETEPLGTGVLTVGGLDYEFDVFTCTLEGYENEGTEFDFTVAGIGSSEGRTFHIHANRSYHPDTDRWVETIDLDYQDGDEILRTQHDFLAAEPERFIFELGPDGVQVGDPVAFGRDFMGDTSAGPGTVVVNCSPPAAG